MPTVTHYVYDDEGEKVPVTFPAHYEVCDRCRGEGKHVNPSIDGHGISREEFDEDPEFEEAYFAGRYDVTCEVCKGERVVLVEDEDQFTDEQKVVWAKLETQWEDEAADRRLSEMERRMGA